MPKASLKAIATDTSKMDWSQWDPWGALRGAAAVAFLLLLGLATGRTSTGAIAAGGALVLGLGSFSRERSKSFAVLLLAGFFMGLSTFLGTWMGGTGVIASLLIGTWGFLGGILVATDISLWFIGLKGVVTLLIASGFPADAPHALERALLVLAGGLVQILFLFGEYFLLRRTGFSDLTLDPTPSFSKGWRTVMRNLNGGSDAFQHALRLSVTLVIAAEIGRFLFTHNAYWVPITVSIILRLDSKQTYARGSARIAGTLAGIGLTSLIVMFLKPEHWTLAFLALGFAWLAFAFFRVNYAVYAVFITGYVVFMLAFNGSPEQDVVHVRLLATLIGGGLALATYVIWPSRKSKG